MPTRRSQPPCPLALKSVFEDGGASDEVLVGNVIVMLTRWATDLADSPHILAQFVKILQSPLGRGIKRRTNASDASQLSGAGANKRARRSSRGATPLGAVADAEADRVADDDYHNDDDYHDDDNNIQNMPHTLVTVEIRSQRQHASLHSPPLSQDDAGVRAIVEADAHGASGATAAAAAPSNSAPAATGPTATGRIVSEHRAGARRHSRAPLSPVRVELGEEECAAETMASGQGSGRSNDNATTTRTGAAAAAVAAGKAAAEAPPPKRMQMSRHITPLPPVHDSAIDVSTPVAINNETMSMRGEGDNATAANFGRDANMGGNGAAATSGEDDAATIVEDDALTSVEDIAAAATASDSPPRSSSTAPASDKAAAATNVGANTAMIDGAVAESSGKPNGGMSAASNMAPLVKDGSTMEMGTAAQSGDSTTLCEGIEAAPNGRKATRPSSATANACAQGSNLPRANDATIVGRPDRAADGLLPHPGSAAASILVVCGGGGGGGKAAVTRGSAVDAMAATNTSSTTTTATTKGSDGTAATEAAPGTRHGAGTAQDATLDILSKAHDTALVVYNANGNNNNGCDDDKEDSMVVATAATPDDDDDDDENDRAPAQAAEITLARLTAELRLAQLAKKKAGPLVFCIPLEDYGKPQEVEAYAEVAAVLVHAFEKWHAGQPSDNVREHDLCMAMHSGGERFREYCASLPLSVVVAGLADTDAETVRAQARKQWSHVQFAEMAAMRRAGCRAMVNKIQKRWQKQLKRARGQRQPPETITALVQQKKSELARVPNELDGMLPPQSSAYAKAKARMEKRCGHKLAYLVRCYGAGVLLLMEPVMALGRMLRQTLPNYVLLLAQLRLCPGFGDFAGAVTAAYMATLQQRPVVGSGVDEQRPIQRLRDIATQRSRAALQRAGTASRETMRMLTQASPLMLTTGGG